MYPSSSSTGRPGQPAWHGEKYCIPSAHTGSYKPELHPHAALHVPSNDAEDCVERDVVFWAGSVLQANNENIVSFEGNKECVTSYLAESGRYEIEALYGIWREKTNIILYWLQWIGTITIIAVAILKWYVGYLLIQSNPDNVLAG